MTAQTAEELREALSVTVGTTFRISRDGETVASGTLGAGEVTRLPTGAYRVELDSTPPQAIPVELASEESVTLTFAREGGSVSPLDRREPASFAACEQSISPAERPAAPARGE